MHLSELKKVARDHVPKIKGYYTMSKKQLVSILSTNVFTEDMIVEKKTLAELRIEAQEKKIPRLWKLKRAELVALLYPSSKQNHQNDNQGEKHDHPQQSECQNVGV